ncbi:MAG: adenosine monophosphate-protein transferase [Candidatus Methanomethylicota archaeon]|jgi:adenosine/AMP kinase|uniref:Adenosine monophosphate-protein transferase n=1 Tax=Thermoproteota archaeon TaxID=2056631 RepID=A0A523BD64_9CREN|nr:MAG: adenosine monophosphate-protein transferase [Candidatus Verstraetearchaeota archaeon]TDA38891.1 MAG: adenosine monophosphate-protein transferase [Candidatus Verstraetearchaeota archaeon]
MSVEKVNIKAIRVKIPKDSNVIIGQTHFIKSIEDLYETIVTTIPKAKFGIAFCEASGPCLIRYEGNDEELVNTAIEACKEIASGHIFVIYIREAYPINILNAIKNVQEVCTIFCATANPLEVIVAETEQGRGILGVIDGSSPKGIETSEDKEKRIKFLRQIGYKK